MRLLINHILTPLFYFCFGGILVVFHPIQIIVFHGLGEMAHRKVVYFMNGLLSKCLFILGHQVKFVNQQNLPKDRPLIIVANHNSLHDIPTLYNKMADYHPVFVSKLSLAKGIPSVSYNLRKSGAALIDRGDKLQSMKEIIKLGQLIHNRNFSAVIFPEGTRRGADLKEFKPGGISALLKKAPNALIVPISIEGTMNIVTKTGYPLNTFQKLRWTVLKPIEPKDHSIEDLLVEARASIAKQLSVQ